ncbi:MAG: formylglycine-generating enzyme family protein [Myxococcales bacterium]|nr:formylglycine-generating enzyme family protein [Myxococcales bacterium]
MVVIALTVGSWGSQMRPIPGGSYVPLYAPDTEPSARVEPFLIDETPVTKQAYLGFVRRRPEWRRDRVRRLFADARYLADWQAPLTPAGGLDEPVVQVSWFAARAYCDAHGKRLPTEHEWEIAASASETKPSARDDPEWTAQILEWYSEPSRGLRPVGQRRPNVFGIHDLHGLVWEWVEDFNATLYGADNREGGDGNELRFCGAGALSASDARDYANFQRAAFRTSLTARSTTNQLGFRCANDLEEQ